MEENEFAFGGEENEFCCRRMSFKLMNFEEHFGSSFPVSLATWPCCGYRKLTLSHYVKFKCYVTDSCNLK